MAVSHLLASSVDPSKSSKKNRASSLGAPTAGATRNRSALSAGNIGSGSLRIMTDLLGRWAYRPVALLVGVRARRARKGDAHRVTRRSGGERWIDPGRLDEAAFDLPWRRDRVTLHPPRDRRQ